MEKPRTVRSGASVKLNDLQVVAPLIGVYSVTACWSWATPWRRPMSQPNTASKTIDPSKAAGIPCLVVDNQTVLATLALSHLLQLVPDPTQFEDKRAQHALFTNPALSDLAEKRQDVQRYFTGAKKSNLPKYADFIFERVEGGSHRGTPPICLGT